MLSRRETLRARGFSLKVCVRKQQYPRNLLPGWDPGPIGFLAQVLPSRCVFVFFRVTVYNDLSVVAFYGKFYFDAPFRGMSVGAVFGPFRGAHGWRGGLALGRQRGMYDAILSDE